MLAPLFDGLLSNILYPPVQVEIAPRVGLMLFWGFFATLILTLVLFLSQGLRWTRMSLPLVLGTIVSGDWDKATKIGALLQFVLGWLLALVYGALFEVLHRATWWLGSLFGLIHGLIILAVIMPLLPSLHPRMAGEYQTPDPTPLLEPPGFMALNYGPRTPLLTLLAHAIYGFVLGYFYTV